MWMFLAFTAISAVTVYGSLSSRAGGGAANCGRQFLRQQLATGNDDGGPHHRPRNWLCCSLGVVEPEGDRPAGSGVWLRLGTADQLANVQFEPEDPDFRLPWPRSCAAGSGS